MKLTLTDEQARMVVDALQYKAHMDTGHSQEPDLIEEQDTEEWELSIDIEKRRKTALHLIALWKEKLAVQAVVDGLGLN